MMFNIHILVDVRLIGAIAGVIVMCVYSIQSVPLAPQLLSKVRRALMGSDVSGTRLQEFKSSGV